MGNQQMKKERSQSVLRPNQFQKDFLTPKKYPITSDYILFAKNELGTGINGKVLLCQHKLTRKKYALKVSA